MPARKKPAVPAPGDQRASWIAELQGLLNKQPTDPKQMVGFGGQYPAVPHAPPFRPEMPVVGQHLGKIMQQYYRMAPQLRGQPGVVHYGPNEGVVDFLGGEGQDFLRWGKVGNELLAMADTQSGNIAVNPSLQRSPEELGTVGHELGHIVGYGDSGEDDQVHRISQLVELLRQHYGDDWSNPTGQKPKSKITKAKFRK